MKVFGIGFHKTGTSSLRDALKILGYSVTGPNRVSFPNIGDTYVDVAREISTRYDAFQDNPWPLVYREMDEMWPDAKFILTTRDPEKWIASLVRHFADRSSPMREVIYGEGRGFPAGNEEHFLRVLEDHNARVREYFADRPQDFLEMDLSAGDGWETLCAFLGQPVPEVEFPHANSAGEREKRQKTFAAHLRRVRRRFRRKFWRWL